MTGHHPFAELRAKMSPEARARADQRAKQLRNEIDLATLRQALKLSQQQLAERMHINQPEVAKIEKRADMLLSTLSGVLRAMGAELKIIASFANHEIRIRSLGQPAGTRKTRVKSGERARKVRRAPARPRVAG